MVNIENRIGFLIENFKVKSDSELQTQLTELKESKTEFNFELVDNDSKLLGIAYGTKMTKEEKFIIEEKLRRTKPDEDFVIKEKIEEVVISEDALTSFIEADPTKNKMYVQWLVNLYVRLVKNHELVEAQRFISEDLPTAKLRLEVFHGNKRKAAFSRLCLNNPALKGIDNPRDINQYSKISQMFDAVVPFLERNPSGLELQIQSFVDSGEGEVVVRDRNFTVFVPKTKTAAQLFANYSSWCTSTGNHFDNYVNGSYSRPDGGRPDLYIIIPNTFFVNGEGELYQMHFESDQLKNSSNSDPSDFYSEVVTDSDAILNYFTDLLKPLAVKLGSESQGSLNCYSKFLVRLGYVEILFDVLPDDVTSIKITDYQIPKLVDMSRFTELRGISISKGGVGRIPESIMKCTKLESLSLPNSNYTSIPKSIKNLKELIHINLVGVKNLVDIPDELGELDETNGGILFKVTYRSDELSEELVNRLKKLLPSADIADCANPLLSIR